jgi:hypothetical protein
VSGSLLKVSSVQHKIIVHRHTNKFTVLAVAHGPLRDLIFFAFIERSKRLIIKCRINVDLFLAMKIGNNISKACKILLQRYETI